MIQKTIEKIHKSDIDALVTNQIAEVRTLEYKQVLPGGSDKDTKEFLADVSSFANASGGDLIFGIGALGGVPTSVPGLSGIDIDAAKLRLEESIRNGIAPRIVGIQMHQIDGFLGPVLLLRIPASFNSPHMVTFKGTSRFYTRNSAGKYQMDVTELRIAFDASGSVSKRLQNFRTERLSKIVAGETPIVLPPTGKLVLHILPLASTAIALTPAVQNTLWKLCPIGSSGWDVRHNLDGFVTFSGGGRGGGSHDTYCQFFRNGRVEAVYAGLLVPHGEINIIAATWIEQQIVKTVGQYLAVLQNIQVLPPLLVTVSMLGVRGAKLETGVQRVRGATLIDRDMLLLPDVIVEEYGIDVGRTLQPIFDAMWNAGGYERSLSYDDSGNWRPRM